MKYLIILFLMSSVACDSSVNPECNKLDPYFYCIQKKFLALQKNEISSKIVEEAGDDCLVEIESGTELPVLTLAQRGFASDTTRTCIESISINHDDYVIRLLNCIKKEFIQCSI